MQMSNKIPTFRVYSGGCGYQVVASCVIHIHFCISAVHSAVINNSVH